MDHRAREAKIPMLPQPGWRSFFPAGNSGYPTFLDAGPLHLVPSGRIAIALALEYLGVAPGAEVLLPAYHCPSMVEPVTWLGAKPVYYRIQPDTSPDLDDFRQKITPLTRAALGVHFFGRVQNLNALQAICRAGDIGFIEDCAHACFGTADGTPVGNFGDIAIASLRKFFPLYDGGCLYSATRNLDTLHTSGLGVTYQLKALIDSIEEPVGFGKMPAFRPFVAGARYLRGQRPRAATPDAPARPASDDAKPDTDYTDRRYCKASMHGRMSLVAKAIFSLAARRRITAARISNYRRLQQELSQLSRARPFFPDLQEQSVPCVFPLEIDDPDVLHGKLKQAGVPMWRWEDLRTDICPISNRFSQTIIQLPCHQELTHTELEHIISATRRILA